MARKNTQQVFAALQGGTPATVGPLATDGQAVTSYGVTIARKAGDALEILDGPIYKPNGDKSTTSAQHRNGIAELAEAAGVAVRRIDGLEF